MPPSLQPSPTLLLPHLPPKTLVGVDLITFTSTANFHGIRDLPSGWHFLYTGTTESLSLRCGAWFHVGDISLAGEGSGDTALVVAQGQNAGPEIHIWRWNPENESLVSLKRDSDSDRQDAMRYKANLAAIWQSGGLFRYRSRVAPSMLSTRAGEKQADAAQMEDDEEIEERGRRDWRQLTDRISPRLLSRIIGDPEVDVDGHPRWTMTSASTANRDADQIPGLGAGETDVSEGLGAEREREFGFLPIDLKRTWREGAIGRERTEAAQDRSWALSDLILRYSSSVSGEITVDERTGESQILGELQFTFLMVLTTMNFSCLQQWKRLLELTLTCRRAIIDRETFMSDVVRLLLRQLQRCDDVEGGLFEIDGDEGGAFLRKLLMKLRRSVDEVAVTGAGSRIRAELEELEAWVKEEYDWELKRESIVRRGMLQLEDGEEVEMDMDDNDEDEETGEYAPQVVDLDEGNAIEEDRDNTIEEDGTMSDADMRY